MAWTLLLRYAYIAIRDLWSRPKPCTWYHFINNRNTRMFLVFFNSLLKKSIRNIRNIAEVLLVYFDSKIGNYINKENINNNCYFVFISNLTDHFFSVIWSLDLTLIVKRWIYSAQKFSIVFNTAWKVSKYGVFSGPYFPPFGLNTERYWISRFSKYDLLASSISFFVIDQFSFCCFLYNPNKAGLFKVSCFSRKTLIQLLNNLFKVGWR